MPQASYAPLVELAFSLGHSPSPHRRILACSHTDALSPSLPF